MDVFLLRHGIAEDVKPGMDDAARSLTAEGRTKLRALLSVAAHAKIEPAVMLSSPYKRAVQSAEIAAKALGYREAVVQTRVLEPSGNPEAIWEEIRAHRSYPSLMLVGHNPSISELTCFLLGCSALQIDFKKGALLRVGVESFTARPRGILRGYLTPRFTGAGH